MRNTRIILHLLLALTVLAAGAACKRSGNANSGANSNSSSTAGDASTTPPFATKEPERYQATMVTSGNMGGQDSTLSSLSGLVTNRQAFVARDGDRRRVDTELLPGVKVAYLQTPAGRFMLLPSKKIYAEIKLDDNNANSNPLGNQSSDFSPDKMLNEQRTGARYEKLGTEEVNGRTTTKYRVTTAPQTGEAKGVTTESIIWVDESLGMPIKAETTTTGGDSNGAKFSMELRDIKTEVDSSVFNLPSDYKKVEYKDIFSQLFPSLLGDEKKK